MSEFNFDETINRIGTHSMKWDCMQSRHGVSAVDGIPMWVADMDFRPPPAVQRAVEAMAGHGIYGYFGDDADYLNAIVWWMNARHQWSIEPDWIFSTHGLVNGTALCIDAFSEPGDAVVLMTPVYHAFARIIHAANRELLECRLRLVDGRYEMDLAAWQQQLSGREKILILCSPHNPGGRVWSAQELRDLAAFCRYNKLIMVSDEIHHDLVYTGHHHTILPRAAPDAVDRTVVLSAASKTFNIAGAHIGNVIIADPVMRSRFAARMMALGISPNAFAMPMVTAAYSPEGVRWLEALLPYLDDNRRVFEAGIQSIKGARSMTLESTYLAWVDFAQLGLQPSAIAARVQESARIAVNLGPTFGAGGETFLRFNFATQRHRVIDAVDRLQRAFA